MVTSAAPLDPAVRAAYLQRLGVEPAPPTVELLRVLVRRQVERVPYETWWIQAGEGWSTDPAAAASRIAFDGRGGYCYHLNGALELLLDSLGFAVHGHTGGVRGDGPAPDAMGNHLALTVTGLPSDDNPGGHWYVDTGLGDALHEPLPLVSGAYVQGPFHLGLERVDDNTWRLDHDPTGDFRTMTWTTGPADRGALAARHAWLSTSPDSGFVTVPMCARRDATGVDVVRGLVPSRVGAGAHTGEPLTRRSDWFALLGDRFGLRFDALPDESRDRLWASVLAAHRAWEARTRP